LKANKIIKISVGQGWSAGRPVEVKQRKKTKNFTFKCKNVHLRLFPQVSFAHFGVDSGFRFSDFSFWLHHCHQTPWENFTHEIPKKARRTRFFMGFEEKVDSKCGEKTLKIKLNCGKRKG